MIKDVIIDIKTEQTIDGQTDNIDFSTEGSFGIREDSYFISYDETALLDTEGEIKTTIFLKPDNTVVLQRKGSYDSKMIIEKGIRTSCFYSTPMGNLTLGVFGEKVLNGLNENGGKLALTYIIDSNATPISRNTVNIFIREVN